MDEVVIGEGVVLEADASSAVTRALEGAVDIAVILFGFLLLSWLLAYVDPAGFSTAAVIGATTLMFVVVPTTVETLTRGRSVGKLAMGTRVVRDDGGPIALRQALTRALIGVFEIWMTAGLVAFVTSLCNRKGKRLGDLVAGTYVVRVRGARAIPPLPTVAPYLSAWARGADIARLPDGLAIGIRLFLARASGMDPASRARVGEDLAGRVEQYVAPGPPWGTEPGAFLAAVMCERRDRDWALGVRNQVTSDAHDASVRRLPLGVPDPVN